MRPEEVLDWRTQWREVRWVDHVYISGLTRGRSAAFFTAKSKYSGAEFNIFLTDLYSMMAAGCVFNGIELSGIFGLKKRGRNLGICLEGVKQVKSEDDWSALRPIPSYI
jgi:hypothetical protein